MNIDMKKLIQNELLSNENVLWKGSPSLSKHFTKQDAFLIPLSVIWTGFMLYVFIIELFAGTFFVVVSGMFVIYGFYLIFGRFIVKRLTKRNTIYAITNLRILIIKTNSEGIKKSISSREIKAISDDSISCDKKGIGTIIFDAISSQQAINLNMGMDFLVNTSKIIAFFDVENCKHVYGIYERVKYSRRNFDLEE